MRETMSAQAHDETQGPMPDQLSENPFTPTFGEVPAHMAGRAMVLNDLRRAFNAKRRHPNLTTAITGARGSGKTALLAQAADDAEARGWVAVRCVALPGMLDDILITARRASSHLVSPAGQAHLSGIEVAQAIGLEWQVEGSATNWRNEMALLLDELAEHDAGLLICIDEVQPSLDEMVQLVAVYQLFVTEGRKVALLMAGLPHNMLALEKDRSVSFLRRAQKVQLGRIPDDDVADAMRRTVRDSGRDINDEALAMAVRATGGFPFMMQLAGFRMWDMNPESPTITRDDAEAGLKRASDEMRDRIVKVTYDSLSRGDQAFLAAMASLLDEQGECRCSDVANRIGKTKSYATQYKNRLLGQGVIDESSSGSLTFQMPLMHEYILENA